MTVIPTNIDIMEPFYINLFRVVLQKQASNRPSKCQASLLIVPNGQILTSNTKPKDSKWKINTHCSISSGLPASFLWIVFWLHLVLGIKAEPVLTAPALCSPNLAAGFDLLRRECPLSKYYMVFKITEALFETKGGLESKCKLEV